MLHVFHLDVVKVDQDITHVAMAIYVCCKYMFQMFQRFSEAYCKCVLNVSIVSSEYCIYCSDYTYIL
jgi:hypothetical protein